MSNFTDKMTDQLRQIAADNGNKITFEQCQEFYNEHSSSLPSARSVISKIKQMDEGIEYIPKQAETKSGEPVVRKSDIVAGIAAAFESAGLAVKEGALDGLTGSSKLALNELARLVNQCGQSEDSVTE